MVGAEDPADGGDGIATGQRETELLVFVRGGDVFVGVRLHPHRHPHHDVLNDSGVAGDDVEAVDLGHRVHDDTSDAGLDRVGEFVEGFVVAVQSDPLGRESGVQGHREFPSTGDVEGQTLLRNPPGDLPAQEGFGGVVHVDTPAEGRTHLAAAGPEVVLIDDEQW